MSRYSSRLIFIFCLTPLLFAASSRTFRMNLGQRVELPSFESGDLEVAPKGIVRITRRSDGKWQAQAASIGTATATLTSLDGHATEYFYFAVSRPSTTITKVRRGEFPSDLCSHPGASCDTEVGLIDGITDSFEWRFHARQICRQTKTCQVRTKLTSDAANRMLEHFRNLVGDQYEIYMTNAGEVAIGIDCSTDSRTFTKEHLDFLTGRAVERGDIGIECRRPSANGRFSIKLRITAVTNSIAQEIGLRLNPAQSYPELSKNMSTDLLGRLRDLESTDTAWNLGEPTVVADLGAKVKLGNGSEFLAGTEVDRHSGESKLHFKATGLEFECQVLAESKAYIRAIVSSKMKSSGRNSQTRLSTNELNTQVTVPAGEETIIGMSEVLGQHYQNSGAYFLGKIPIIGPLFSNFSRDSNQVVVVVSITIQKLTD